jgi:hypothetical protein
MHHASEDVVDAELDCLDCRVVRAFHGISHDGHMTRVQRVIAGHHGSSDTVTICVHSQLSCKHVARGSQEEVVQHCLLEWSRICSQSWKDMSLECVGPTMISRGLSSPVILRTAVRIFEESAFSGSIRSLKVTELSRLRVAVSSSRKGRMASGLPEKMMPGGKVALPGRGITVLAEKKGVVHATWHEFAMH